LEKNGEKYKIKRYLGMLGSIRPMLNNLDLTKLKSTGVVPGSAYYYVKFGEQSFATSNADDIKDLLDWTQFDKITKYDLSQYHKCD
jgi:hypothetical protein